jgi:uncharacterized protein (UPF0548 family)
MAAGASGGGFSWRRPALAQIDADRAALAATPLSYASVGATRDGPRGLPAGFAVDHNMVLLGRGPEAFAKGRAALARWAMFDTGFTTITPAAPAIAEGQIVGIVIRAASLWCASYARIVYVLSPEEELEKSDGGVMRAGFAYGTLPAHLECGEERFSIEWRRDDDTVWYDLLAFSRPQHPLVRIARPYARLMQRRFAQRSLLAMQEAAR